MTSTTTGYTSRELAEQTAQMLNRDSGHSVSPALDDDQRLYFIVDHEYDVRGQEATGDGAWTIVPHESCPACGTPCDVCRTVPRESGAQFDMAEAGWNGIRLNVCSNCMHANPVSITALAEAADRITAEQQARAKAAGDDPWAGDYSPF